jgi:glutamine amidotransferase-like uncharacterized protein
LFIYVGMFVQSAWGGVALIYDGPGSCNQGCAFAAAQVAAMAGLQTRFIGTDWSDSSLFKDVVLWIQPGGDAIEVANALSSAQKESIRRFVAAGGGYVGICAGAFFSDTWVDDNDTVKGLGIIPVTTGDFGSKTPVITPVNWMGTTRYLYLEEGAYFKVEPTSPVRVIATYADGKPATIYSTFYRGRVAVSGVHPEAPEIWKQGLIDPDGPDMDLGVQMIQWALPRR